MEHLLKNPLIFFVFHPYTESEGQDGQGGQSGQGGQGGQDGNSAVLLYTVIPGKINGILSYIFEKIYHFYSYIRGH